MKNYKIDADKRFEEYDEELRENKFFIFKYFSTVETDAKEYKYIPKECLDDKYFVFACLEKNPDIYIIADNVHSNEMFEYLKKNNKNSFLKYASKEKIADKNFCLAAINESSYNYPFLPKEMKEDRALINKIFENLYISEDIAKSIPSSVIKDREFMKSLFNKNVNIFVSLKKYFKKDREIMKMIVLKKSHMFKYADNELKLDKDWVNSILEERKSWGEQYSFNWDKIRNFDFSSIFTNLTQDYFLDSVFINKNLKEIIESYKYLNKEIRGTEVLLKNLYNADDLPIEVKNIAISKNFIKSIPIEELKEKMLNVAEGNSYLQEKEEIEDSFKKISIALNYYFLNKNMQKNSSEITVLKRNKI